MSTTIDHKVVEMRFDNKHFEQHTKESMSTLDKLKAKLNFKDSAKSLQNLNSSANKVNMGGLSGALDTCRSKFSAMEIVGITALANITNSAVNAGKRMIAALTIDPVKTGFSEYETQINAIQTILANTQKEGTNVEIVNKALDELNEYADMTIYNFTEMTRNIGTFTAAGVKLDESVKAIKGIANLAAMSGSTSQQASTAMYQLSQALASGTVKLMDWNSVVNAGMGGQVFQDALKETARVHGIAIDTIIEQEGSFRDSLHTGWLSSEILTETLEHFTMTAEEGTAQWDEFKKSLMSQGYTEAQAAEILKLGNTATEAATKVKTFTQLWSVLQEAAQSGWAQSWRIIVGDFEEAKVLLSELAEFFTGADGIITKMSNARNKLLEGALGKNPFTAILDKISNSSVLKTAANVSDKINGITRSLEYYQDMVNKVWRGDYKNQPYRSGLLEAEGHNYGVIQTLVNKGYQYKLTVDDVAAAEKKYGIVATETTKTTDKMGQSLAELTDEKLKEIGLTDEEIKVYRQLEEQSKKTGKSIDEILKSMDQRSGRELLIDSFRNFGSSLVSIFKSIGDAWRDAFPPMNAFQLYNLIEGLNKFSVIIKNNVENNADELTRTLKGLFAILDLITMVIGGGFKIAFTILKTILSVFNLDLLDFTALIGDAIVKFRDWVENNNLIVKGIKKLAEYISIAVVAIKNWITNNETIIKGFKKVQSVLKSAKDGIQAWFQGLKEADNIPKYIFEGLINGLKKGTKTVYEFIINFGKGIIEAIKDVLGIHSPSTEFFEIGKNIVQGLYNGVSEAIKMVYNLFMSVGGKLIEIVKNLDLGSLFTIAIGAGSVYGIVKIAKALEALTSPMEVFTDIGEKFKKTLSAFNGVLRAFKFRLYAESVKTMAIAIAILAGSIAVLTLVDQGKMWSAIGAITALAAVLGILTFVSGKIGGKEGVQFGKLALTLLALGVSMAIMAGALKKIASINSDQAIMAIGGYVLIVGSMIGLMAVANKSKSGFIKLGTAFLGMASALLIMAMVAKMLGKMDRAELIQGGVAIVAFSGIIIGLMAATKLITGSKNVDKIAKTIAKVGTAILMMAIVTKMLGKMDRAELIQGTLAITAFGGIIVGLMAATKLITGSSNVGKIGGTIAGIAGAMLMMAVAVRVLGMMDTVALLKGTLAITAFGGIIVGLIAATKLAGKDLDRVGRTILMLSVSIGLLGITATLLSLISWEGLAKGLIAVGLLSAFMAGLVAVTALVPKGVMGTLITLTTAIGILALTLGILSAINPDRLTGATVALGVILGIFALVVAVTSLVPQAMGTMIVITVAIGLLAGALIALGQLPIEQSLGAAAGLSMVLLSLAAMLGILALVGMGGPAALIGIASLAVAIVGIGGLIIAIGALMDKFPKLEEFLNKGIPILEKIGHAIGSFFGNIVAGFATAATSGLPEIGLMLSQFMTNVTPFINGMKTVDAKTLAGVGILTAAIIALSAANLIEGITSFLTFGSSFADLGTQLSQFMTNAMPFIATAMMIPPGVVESVRALAETIMILTTANLIEGISKFLGGGSSLENFGSQLKYLAIGIREFTTELGPLSPEQVETAKNAAAIIQTLATAAKKIPNTGGLLADLVGENDMAEWAKQLPTMAEGIIGFVNKLTESGIDSSAIETADTAAKIIQTLASAAKEIPNAGGLLADIVGDNELSTFADQFPKVGEGIVGFIKTMNEAKITNDQAEVANTAAKIIKTLAKAAKEIPNAGGFLAGLVGDNELGTFADQFPKVGEGIAGFVQKLGTLTADEIDSVNSAVKLIKAIASLAKNDMSGIGTNLVNLGKNLVTFGKKVKSFTDKMADIGSKAITSAVSNFKKLVNMAKTVIDIDNETFKSFGDSLKKLAKSGVKDFVKEFSGETPKGDAKKGAKALVQAVINGIKDKGKKDKLKDAAKSLSKEAIKAMSSDKLKSDATNAGKDLCQGLINGLKNKDKRNAVYNAAYSLGQLAVQGEKDGQKSKSPSKATEQAGKWLGEGLVIGIHKMGSRVYGAGKSMGEEATNSISSALNTAMNLLNSDMDTQPTIRPVLDLSDVESGVGSISSLFNNGPSLGVAANLKAINSGMNARSQNGTNNDVVSAINRLGRNLDNVGGDVYNINGVTANDDSGLADAVRTIIRAANIERRI